MNPNTPTSSSEGGARIQGDVRDASGPGPQLMTADTLEGDKVMNLADDTLGEISDIMLDVSRGRIAYAVMKSGGFLGMGAKMFAIPWSALTLDTERHCFVLDADKQTFADAPGFDKDRWPDSASDPTFHSDLHRRFHAPEYWQ